jgi:fused signal recognition particle receptor
MTFDWFRRRYDEEKPEEPKAAEPETAQPTPEVKEDTPDPAADYLNYAKLAYENIRKRQQEAAQGQDQVSLDSPAPEPIAEPAPEPSTELPADAITAAPAESPVTAEPSLPVVEPAEPEPEPEATPEPATSLPFWAAAEAERLARLEQLRETAIAEPEPEPEPVKAVEPATPATVPDLPDFILDEGFVWSTEILAAQGRRPDQISIEEITWLKRLRQGLDKTRRGLVNQLRAIVGQGPLNQDAVMEIEAALLQADVGVEATDAIIEALQSKLRSETLPPDAAITYLKQIIRDMLDRPLGEYGNLTFAPEKDTLNIWLMTGVNGAGKTTTIGKLAHIAQKSGYNCLIAAADTFRAAAVEQVKVWGARSGVEVIANPGKNTDPAAVVFDGITAAQARGADLLLIDTAGRLQNKKNLMDELSKVRRIIDKKAPDAKVESLLVLDSTLGQNGLRQAQVFSESAKLSGVVLTKLDGTAKGGIALAVVQQLGLPIRFIGAGEGIEDLRPFSSYEFVEALLNG